MKEKEIVELIIEIDNRRKELEEHLPYELILLKEAKANENVHTRILMQILKYKNGDQYPFLKSFLERMEEHVWASRKTYKPSENIKTPSIDIFADNMDGRITDDGQYAVVIENKIEGAVDQNEQIDRYIQSLKGNSYKSNKIFVIYLTNDGSKHVEDYSFTNTAKSNLDYKCDSNNGRFVMMNYRYDILPWLEQDVLPFCYNKDQSLISGLNQYISFFKYRYNLTKELMEINIKLANMINDKFENEGKNNNVEKYQYINELEESVCRAIGEYKMRIKNEILKKDVLEKIKNDISIFDSDLQFNEEIIDDKPNNCIYFRICKNKKFWRTMCIIVGFFNINLFVQISRRDNTNTNVFPIDNMKFDCLESDKHTYFGSKLWNSDVFGKDLKIDELKLKIKNICNEIKIKDQNIMNVKSSIMSIDTDKK